MQFLRPVLLGLGLTLTQGLAFAAGSSQREVAFDLPPQPLSSALNAFAQQSELNLVLYTDVTEGMTSPEIRATLTPETALKILLAPANLTYEFSNNSVTIWSQSRFAARGDKTLRMANDAARSGDSASGVSSTDLDSDKPRPASAAPRATSDANDVGPAVPSARGIPEVLIKGSRSTNVDIARTEDDVQPYVVFDSAQIRRSSATSVEDFLRTRLPMNAVAESMSQSDDAQGNQSAINLRGLGTNQTLILVDGRRMPGINEGVGGGFGQPDINGFPLAAIERIEVLPSTASGIYGGGATGGVVNIITRKDFAGVDVTASYGNTFDTDASTRRIDARTGLNLEGGRTRLMLAGSFSDSNPLLAGDRDFITRARELQFQNNPSAFLNATTAAQLPLGYTTNIRNTVNQPLRLKPAFGGAVLSSPFTYVPEGYVGVASDNGAALIANAGQYNLEVPEDFNSARRSLLNNPTVSSATLNLRREFTPRVESFIDLSWLDNEGHTFPGSAAPGSVTLQANAPNNPFTTAVNLRFPTIGPAGEMISDSETVRGVGGVIVRLPRGWTLAADYAWNRSRYTFSTTSFVVGDPDGTGPGISAATAYGNGSLDLIRDINKFRLDYSPYLLPSPNSFFGPADTILKDATVRISGPIMDLPSGPLTVSAHIERRDEEAQRLFHDTMNASAVPTTTYYPKRSQDVTSYYLETRIPVVSRANARTFAQGLELQLSSRHDRYETRAPDTPTFSLASRERPIPEVGYQTNEVSATKYTFGIRYTPFEAFALRASFGTGFLPPSIDQIVPVPEQPGRTVNLADPKRGGVARSTTLTLAGGGNPNLLPEESESWSAGAVFSPSFAPDFRLSLDYTHIEKVNEIRTAGTQGTLNNEDLLPGRVTRAPLTPQDIALGYTGGELLKLDGSLINMAETRVEAWDAQADYALQTERAGAFRFYLLGTYQPHLEIKTLPVQPFVETSGYNHAGGVTGSLKWRGNGGITWERGSVSLGWDVQYYDAYRVYTSLATPTVIQNAVLSQGSETVPSQTYHDFFVRYRMDDTDTTFGGVLANTELMIGIQNAFDQSPPILATTAAFGGYSLYGDPRLRRYLISLRKSF